jgi:hypothetical protein
MNLRRQSFSEKTRTTEDNRDQNEKSRLPVGYTQTKTVLKTTTMEQGGRGHHGGGGHHGGAWGHSGGHNTNNINHHRHHSTGGNWARRQHNQEYDNDTSNANANANSNTAQHSRPAACCAAVFCSGWGGARMCGWWLIASMVFWVLLWGVASSYPGGKVTFTLNVGETWQVRPPPLWSRSTFEIRSTTPAATATTATATTGLEVYSYTPVLMGDIAECPGTSGPMKTVQSSQSIVLQLEQNYHYDSFHLNEGSTITVHVQQQQGMSNLYLLRGYEALRHLEQQGGDQTVTNVRPIYFRKHSILKGFSGQGASSTITYPVLAADVYIVVYDNVSSSVATTTKLVATTTVNVATHFLQHAIPFCNTEATEAGCAWTLDDALDRRRVAHSCFIVKAVRTSTSSTSSNMEDDDKDDTVATVELHATIESRRLVWIASLPLLVGLLLWTKAKQKSWFLAKAAAQASLSASSETAPLQRKHKLQPPGVVTPNYRAVPHGTAPEERPSRESHQYSHAPIILIEEEDVIPTLLPPRT